MPPSPSSGRPQQLGQTPYSDDGSIVGWGRQLHTLLPSRGGPTGNNTGKEPPASSDHHDVPTSRSENLQRHLQPTASCGSLSGVASSSAGRRRYGSTRTFPGAGRTPPIRPPSDTPCRRSLQRVPRCIRHGQRSSSSAVPALTLCASAVDRGNPPLQRIHRVTVQLARTAPRAPVPRRARAHLRLAHHHGAPSGPVRSRSSAQRRTPPAVHTRNTRCRRAILRRTQRDPSTRGSTRPQITRYIRNRSTSAPDPHPSAQRAPTAFIHLARAQTPPALPGQPLAVVGTIPVASVRTVRVLAPEHAPKPAIPDATESCPLAFTIGVTPSVLSGCHREPRAAISPSPAPPAPTSPAIHPATHSSAKSPFAISSLRRRNIAHHRISGVPSAAPAATISEPRHNLVRAHTHHGRRHTVHTHIVSLPKPSREITICPPARTPRARLRTRCIQHPRLIGEVPPAAPY